MEGTALDHIKKQDLFNDSYISEKKREIITLFSYVGVTCMFIFGGINIFEHILYLGLLEIFVGFVGIANLIFLKRHDTIEFAADVILFFMMLMLTLLFVLSGVYESGIYWFYTYPILAFFLKGKRFGLFWLLGLVFVNAVIYVCISLLSFPIPLLSPLNMVILIGSLSAVSILIYMNELIRQRTYEIILEQREQLKSSVLTEARQNQLLEKRKIELSELLETLTNQQKIADVHAEELKKFKLAVENASQHIVITDTDGKILYGNKAAEQLTGFSLGEMLGKTPALWGRQMSQEFYKKMWGIIKDEKKTFSGEITNKKKTGQTYIAKATISPVLDEQGEVSYYIGLEEDVTKKRELEVALLKEKEIVENMVVERTRELQEEHMRLIVSINSIPFGFMIANKDHTITMHNKVLGEMFNLTDEKMTTLTDIAEAIGNSFDLKAEVEWCVTSQNICTIDDIIYDKKILRGIASPIVGGANGSVLGYTLMLEDITEAKVLERSRDEFFSIASHELRTPLTAIRGNAQMLQDTLKPTKKNKDSKEMVDDIYTASIRLIDIVNDFLEVSRLEQGRIDIKKMNFDVEELILEVIKDMKEVSAEKKVKITLASSKKKLPQVFADRARAEQVLFNLLGNALKFTPKGTITVATELINGFVKISVTDNGIGISEANQVLLFRKFQQAGDHIIARDVTQGTGLGLYISHLLVSKMGGTIGLVSSKQGEGSTFAFTLPVAS